MKNKTTHTANEFPNLENLKSQNGFETPTGYFDTLHNSIMNEVKEETKPREISFYKVFAYAASIIILVGVSSMLFFNTPETTEEYDYVYESFVNYDEITVGEYTAEFTEVDLELDENLLFDEIALN
jgi:hypothetical protein